MPLIVMCGIPSSGKTSRTQELKQYFEEQGKEVLIVSEYEQIVKAGFDKTSLYADSNKEKHIRGQLKSEVLKLITANNVVILDALNYIKGYRYELFCGTKVNKCLQCTILTQINIEQAWSLNENRDENIEKYERKTFDELVMRFEEPIGTNRWDSPLFIIFPEDKLDTNAIFTSLFKKKPPKPNMSTQNPPLSSTNYLYDLDQITNSITNHLIKEVQNKKTGEVPIPNLNLNVDISNVTVPQLLNLRRQYITYSKLHTPDNDKIGLLFVQYLTTSLKTS